MAKALTIPATRCELCGFDLLALSYEESVEFFLRQLAAKNGGWVVTLNLEILSNACLDTEYRNWIGSAEYIVADGMPLVWASKIKRGVAKVPGRTAGSDLSADLIKRVPASDVAIIGGVNPPRALKNLQIERHDDVFVFDGKVKLDDASIDDLANQIAAHGASLIFIALGVPKQDLVAIKLRKRFPEALILGVGGTFELIAGLKPRAPQWMQKSGLEWLWRLSIEPRRLWRRYLVLYWVGVLNLLTDVLRGGKAPQPGATRSKTSELP
ncbi:MAG: WecB/TagA/CpsF family glycosyltransferase [Armatimonadetes bacterium]|nr:WecB/TagA/CpsF family glycosyltransferase [Armatimonadota bacterium]